LPICTRPIFPAVPPRAVTQAHLDRIAAYDRRGPLINSLITVNPRALEEADRLDEALRTTGRLVGPLHGIPVVIKDNIDVVGLPMTAGFQGWKNYVPPDDAQTENARCRSRSSFEGQAEQRKA
jgi:Asp-tRNA(Asn)/Glu-tRNA(Gln) amidotransferase A subunit family amidase